jgi:methylthioribulose-1-phosphate dehydratase
MTYAEAARTLCRLGRIFGERGWLPATSGNLSIRLQANPLLFAITRSGADKQCLEPRDIIRVDAEGRVVDGGPYKPSAETVVHITLYQALAPGCILHVHSLYNNLVSEWAFERGAVTIARHELLKALGHWEEDATIDVPVVENFADLDRLAAAVRDAARPGVPGVLVRNHGIYAWGEDAFAAKRHLEAFEFLFEYVIKLWQLGL